MTHGIALAGSYTFAKSMMLRRHGLQQPVRLQQYACAFVARSAAQALRIAAVYRPQLEELTTSRLGRTLLNRLEAEHASWSFSSGRPFRQPA
jgi:hypothetical protein